MWQLNDGEPVIVLETTEPDSTNADCLMFDPRAFASFLGVLEAYQARLRGAGFLPVHVPGVERKDEL